MWRQQKKRISSARSADNNVKARRVLMEDAEDIAGGLVVDLVVEDVAGDEDVVVVLVAEKGQSLKEEKVVMVKGWNEVAAKVAVIGSNNVEGQDDSEDVPIQDVPRIPRVRLMVAVMGIVKGPSQKARAK